MPLLGLAGAQESTTLAGEVREPAQHGAPGSTHEVRNAQRNERACMVRRALDASIVPTAIAICFLLCMRGGRAFAACCARSCRNDQPSSFAAFDARPPRSCSRLGIGSDYLTRRGHQSIARTRRESPEARRRRARHGKHAVMSSSSALSATANPEKRHRNDFLLTLQYQQQQHRQQGQRQPAGGHAAATPATTRAGQERGEPGGDSSTADLRNSNSNDGEDGPLALVILNAHGEGESKGLLRHLWARSALRVCADGGANRLHDSFDSAGDASEERARYVPDVIVGDLDSLRPDVARYYENLGAEIKVRDDQDHCDFEKCLVEVENWLSSSTTSREDTEASAAAAHDDGGGGDGKESRAPAAAAAAAARPGATVVGLGAFGGRFDHEMQAISLLHAYTSRFHRLVLMGAGNVGFLLEPGLDHAIEPDLRFEGPTVGLIPVGGPCRAVTTEGLRWNLDGGGLEFGVCVSSSNLVEEEMVRVTTDAPLVWTAEFKPAAWIEAISSGNRGV